MVWFRIPTDKEWKGHVGDVTFMAAMARSLQNRGMNVVIEAGSNLVNVFYLHLNTGMVLANAQKEEIELDGLKIRFLMQDVSVILSILDRCEPRDDIGVTYYKIHARFNCLCTRPDQFERFRNEMLKLESLGRAIEKAEHEIIAEKVRGSNHVEMAPKIIPGVVEA